jgi:hypothetical protein
MTVIRSVNTGKVRFLPFFSVGLPVGFEYNRCCVFDSLYARCACVICIVFDPKYFMRKPEDGPAPKHVVFSNLSY